MPGTLGENLARIRHARGLSQTQLCIKGSIQGARFDRKMLSRWETGKHMPNWRNLTILSEILNCPLSDLLGTEVSNI